MNIYVVSSPSWCVGVDSSEVCAQIFACSNARVGNIRFDSAWRLAGAPLVVAARLSVRMSGRTRRTRRLAAALAVSERSVPIKICLQRLHTQHSILLHTHKRVRTHKGEY